MNEKTYIELSKLIAGLALSAAIMLLAASSLFALEKTAVKVTLEANKKGVLRSAVTKQDGSALSKATTSKVSLQKATRQLSQVTPVLAKKATLDAPLEAGKHALELRIGSGEQEVTEGSVELRKVDGTLITSATYDSKKSMSFNLGTVSLKESVSQLQVSYVGSAEAAGKTADLLKSRTSIAQKAIGVTANYNFEGIDLGLGAHKLKAVFEGDDTYEKAESEEIKVGATTVAITSPQTQTKVASRSATLSGTVVADTTVRVVAKSQESKVLGASTANSDGEWSVEVDTLAEGMHTYCVVEVNTTSDTHASCDEANEVALEADVDGISAAEEDSAPNNGDGNGDGIKDSMQADVVSFMNKESNTIITLDATHANCATELTNVSSKQESELGDSDGFEFDYGLIDYTVHCQEGESLPEGEVLSAVTTVFFGELIDIGHCGFHKFVPSTSEYITADEHVEFATHGVGDENVTVANITLVDGGPLDEDGEVNGVIKDPIGMSHEEEVLAETGSETITHLLTGLVVIYIALMYSLVVKHTEAE